jgi:transposase-like protein
VCALLGLRPHQRRTDQLSALAAGLACEVAYAKASRLLADLTGVAVSARTIRGDVVAAAPDRLGPRIAGEVPIVMLDGTGERAGDKKLGVQLHLAIGLVARRRAGRRTIVRAELLAATLDEDWTVMGDLLADVIPGLIVVDGEPELDRMIAKAFPDTPVQRCLFHLARGMGYAAWCDGKLKEVRDAMRARLADLLADAYRTGDLDAAQGAYRDLIDLWDAFGAPRTAAYLRAAEPDVFTFITHPDAGRLVFGDRGRPELATGVLERVMRELNRRTDVGVRWTIDGLRALLMTKLARKYDHPAWSPPRDSADNQTARMSLAA